MPSFDLLAIILELNSISHHQHKHTACCTLSFSGQQTCCAIRTPPKMQRESNEDLLTVASVTISLPDVAHSLR